MNILSEIQKELKAPKNQKNNFGGYNYRSCEDILEAVKPLLNKYELALIIKDEIVAVLDRVYVKATVTIYTDKKEIIGESVAFARESLTKKGMDDSQITGATSSYARKYALNGLFAIDDTKDADTMDNRESAKQSAKPAQSAKQSQYFEEYKKEIVNAGTIDKVDALAADARKNMKQLNWTKDEMQEFANLIKNRKAYLQEKIDKEI